jgi:hypothetical protein
MRNLILILMLALAGCGSSDDDSLLSTQIKQDSSADKAQLAGLTAQVQTLQAQLVTTQNSLKKLQLVGKPLAGTAKDAFGNFITRAISVAVDFGPCPDMGVQEGDVFAAGNGPLGASFQAFKNCTGTHAEYDAENGALKIANRVYFTTPDCTPPAYVWEADGQGYNSQTLDDGLVFINGANSAALWVQPHQVPQMIQAGSVFIIQNQSGSCQPDGDLQPMWATVPNDTSLTGVPSNGVGKYQSVSP